MSPLIVQARGGKPRVILGLMTFGPDSFPDARISSSEKANEVLDLLQSRGYNEVDTARMYISGEQEKFTRDVLKWKERGLELATKVIYPREKGDNSRQKVRESVEKSLKDLGTESVDLLYLHCADRTTPFAETLEEINALHKEGKFVRFGLSNFTSFEVAEIVLTCKHNGWVLPSVYQGMYNAITRGIEKELIPACRRYGLDLVVYNPLAGGLFSGKIKTKDFVPAEGRFSDVAARTGKLYRDRYFKEGVFEALGIVEKAVEKNGLTMVEGALRWIVHHSELRVLGGNDGIIVGVSGLEQLRENLDAVEKGPLPEEVVKAFEEAWEVAKGDAVDYWHKELKYEYDTREALFGAGAK
ncbi:putative aflatoxin B1 aldehyde reductase member [Podospora fimiseda]|uniref:Aflatoxin B1 aldehyde reductase member n=1 Tax=Podospora fimiseda TaxID=252190 RepID=A0AAN7GW55_9PEZI|nr:putative aflatoxin B1 aldehyde reductase member [Podospora fimiseda]